MEELRAAPVIAVGPEADKRLNDALVAQYFGVDMTFGRGFDVRLHAQCADVVVFVDPVMNIADEAHEVLPFRLGVTMKSLVPRQRLRD